MKKMIKSASSKNLKSALKKGEDYKTEFKEKVDKSLAKEIVAFANSSGGQIYIGITDKGKIKGVEATNELKSQIEDIARKCDPKIPISPQVIQKEKILIVKVKESKDKPHRCSSGFYIRSGSSSQKLSRDEILGFAEDEDLLNFDKILCKEFDFKKDFDREKLFSFMDSTKKQYSRRNYIQLLENLKVAKRQNSKVIFNNSGALFFSKDLNRIYSHTEIACGAFKGKDKVIVLDSARFNTDLIGNVEGAMSFLWKNLRARHELIPKSTRRINVLEIPSDALREALINAVTHRNYRSRGVFIQLEIYDDRVEISNLGGLHRELKKSEFGTKSVTRNPLIAALMLRAGHIEQMGTGITKMRRLVKKEGLKPIKFKFTNFTTVTFYRPPYPLGSSIKLSKSDINFSKKSNMLRIKGNRLDRVLKILNAIENKDFSTIAFSKIENVVLRTVERDILFLRNKKFIFYEGYSKFGKYQVTEKYKKLKKSIK